MASTRQRPMTAFHKKSREPPSLASPNSAFDFILKTRPKSAPALQNEPITRPMSHAEHRRYSPTYPTANRLLAKLWDDTARKKHLNKLASMKAQVDNRPPKVYVHLECRMKKLQLQQEKKDKIKHENELLLQRMNRKVVPFEFHSFAALQSRKIGSERKRKEEWNRIQIENKILIQRVEDRKPHYNRRGWSQERKQNLVYLTNIAKFPENYEQDKERPISSPGKFKVRLNRSVKLQLEAKNKKKS